jgi:hypothetical protein
MAVQWSYDYIEILEVILFFDYALFVSALNDFRKIISVFVGVW